MKYLIVLIDGMADYPLSELDGKTPLEKAETPVLDKLASCSEMGKVQTVPADFAPGSDVANMSVLGYDPQKYYTGRSPFEALSIGVDLKKEDVVFRCNLVTLSEEKSYSKKIMKDYSAGEISTTEAEKLIKECQKRLGTEEFKFYSGVSYRHVLVWENSKKKFTGKKEIELTPPHDISDQNISEFLPQGAGSQKLLELMEKSTNFLSEHKVNLKREIEGKASANSIWLWGQGTRPDLPHFEDELGLTGSVISAVDLIKGLGIAAGLKTVDVEGATGRIDTNFTGKAEAAVNCLRAGDDFVYLHFEAADEAGHQGSLETKIKAIEKVDKLVLKYILEELENESEYSLMILPDHYTPLSKRTHISDPVPFMIFRGFEHKLDSNFDIFSEKNAEKADLFLKKGHNLIKYFIEQ